MKKVIALILAMVMVMSLAACGAEKEPEATVGTVPPMDVPASALEILEKVWAKYSDDEKFPVMGGDALNMVDGAPGNYPIDGEGLASDLFIPAEEVAKVDAISCLRHAMMANNFTGAVYHITNADDVAGFAEAMYNALSNAQWICGMPEKMIITVIDTEYVFVAFGLNDALAPFETALTAAYPDAENKYSEAIAR